MSGYVTLSAVLAVGSPLLPTTERRLADWVRDAIGKDCRRRRPRAGRGGGHEYDINLFPLDVRAALARDTERPAQTGDRPDLWSAFERLPRTAQEEAERRLDAVNRVASLSGSTLRQVAVGVIAREVGVSTSTLWGWIALTDGVARGDWLAALAPRRTGRTATADCDPRAWDFLVADYLRPEEPSFASCHRRLTEAAAEHGWSPIPSAKTLQRRIEREIPRTVATVARQGPDGAARIFPHQRRDRSVFHAMQAVNADGHKIDVFVRMPGGKVTRVILLGIQDLFSGMVLAWRLAETENWGVVRNAFGDLVERHGIPEHVYLDNGRGFASKWLTGGMPNRYRFKVKDDEPAGLLTKIGCTVHWATPYHGQAKPIERAFRDLAEEIAKHPRCAGAYTGNAPHNKPTNYGQTAIDFAALQALVAQEIVRHNARTGRRTGTAKGRSFAATFAESLAAEGTMVRRATDAQRRMFLLAAEGVTCRAPTGEIHLADTRYWAEELADLAGRRVTVRFDPDDLAQPISVYAADGRFLCEAPPLGDVAFNDMDAAREHARTKRQWVQTRRRALDLEQRLSIDAVASLMPAPAPMATAETKVVRMVAGARGPAAGEDVWSGTEGFARAVRAMAEGEVIPFARKEEGGQ